MAEYKHIRIPDETPAVRTAGDWLTVLLAFLGAVKVLLAAPPFYIQVPDETFDAVLNIISILFTGYGIWKNTYLSTHAKKQKKVLQDVGLKEKPLDGKTL